MGRREYEGIVVHFSEEEKSRLSDILANHPETNGRAIGFSGNKLHEDAQLPILRDMFAWNE